MSHESQRPFTSTDGFLSPFEARVQLLLEEILETDACPEQVSGGDRELERVLRERLQQVHRVHTQMEALFPTPIEGVNPARRLLLDSLQKEDRLPEIAGYEVLNVIGAGGMGVVYRARHIKLNRLVAIKMVLLGSYASRRDMECLLQEAQSVAALRHPNIVQVYDVGEHDGFPYFAMELLEGGDLAKTLEGKPRAVREAVDLIRVLAGAVHAAHLGGIVHRDLKPGNIFLDSDGAPKIGDFSLSRRFDLDSTILTNVRQAGTPSYMAPEQAAGKAKSIQPAIDIYSLGAVLYELLTGRPPFTGETAEETRRQVIEEEPVPPIQLNPRVPRDLQTICLTCLQKDPARRYKTAIDLANDLKRFSRGEPIHARPVGIAERVVKWCRRRPATTLAIFVTVVSMIGAVGGGIWLQQVEHARYTQETVRRERARTSIASALSLLSQYVKSRQWSDAAGVLSTAQANLSDADSPELDVRVAAAAEEFEIAQDLDRIRQSFPEYEVGETGFTIRPTSDYYGGIFRRLEIGGDVEVHTAAERVRISPLREQLLMALDHAAFAERYRSGKTDFSRHLAVGRIAVPNPWQDRFRDPATWGDLASLQRLVNDAATAEPAPPSHQMVMIAIRLRSLGANATAVKILREAQLREPSDFWVNLEFGHTLRIDGNPSEAVQFLRVATAQKPTNFVAWTELGQALVSSGRSEEAIAPFRRAIAIQTDLRANWGTLIYAFAACERWDEALATEREAMATNPRFEMPAVTRDLLHVCRARSAAVRREWPIAAMAYPQALEGIYANNVELWFEFAAVSVLADDASGYQKICASMLEQCEQVGLRRFLVARACTLGIVSEQELANASKLALPELDQYANSYWSLTQRAALLCRAGKYEDAIPILERSLQANSQPEQCVITWAWLARAHLGLGDHDAAKSWLEKTASYLDQSAGKPKEIHLHNWLEAQILRHEMESN